MGAILVIGTTYEDQGVVVLGRVRDWEADLLVQADFGSITLKLFDESSSTPNTAIYSATLTVSSVIYNTLQTGGGWTVDSTGWNFRTSIAGQYFADPCHQYRCEVLFAPTGAETFFGVAQITTIPVRTS